MTSPSMLALANYTPAPRPSVEPPELGVALKSWQAELIDGYLRYDTGDPLTVVYVYGTVARLWTSPERLTLDEMLTMDTIDTPLARFRAWFEALPAEVHANVVDTSYIAMEILLERLDDLGNESTLAAAWLRERDEMESVALALSWIGHGNRKLLDNIDAEARTYASTWRHEAKSITDSEHLRAVAWQEPESLVGSLVGQCYGV